MQALHCTDADIGCLGLTGARMLSECDSGGDAFELDGNQLTTHDGNAAAYDANGNLAEANPALTYSHNTDNRLVAATNDLGMSPVYYYDALGRRLARCSADGQVWTRYYYDGLNIVMTRESSAATGGAGS